MAARLSLIRSHLDERAWRLLLGAEAKALGRGGITAVAAAGGVHPDTVAQGVRELDYPEPIPGRVRRPGAGRPRVTMHRSRPGPGARRAGRAWLARGPRVAAAMDDEVHGQTRRRALRGRAPGLGAHGGPAAEGLRLQPAGQHQGRGRQRSIPIATPSSATSTLRRPGSRAAGDPVISVDTKKKELIGNYAAAGREWEPAGQPVRVDVHDFPDPALGKVAPYGVYDITTNTGWVNVGTDADTGQFAVESIRRWWHQLGAPTYPSATRLLITADSGGSNGSRLRLWKTELASFAQETGLDDHRMPPPTRHLQMEQNRAPAVLRDQPQLARTPPGIPRGRHRNPQSRHHPHRPGRARRTGHQHLPPRHQNPRPATSKPSKPPAS